MSSTASAPASLMWLLLVEAACAASRSVQGRSGGALSEAEEKHARPFWRLGDGFEGSASDYAEYVVWSLGVIGVFVYLMSPSMRRNYHADDAEFEASAQKQQMPFGPDDEVCARRCALEPPTLAS